MCDSNAAIQGLREQILDNALQVYAEKITQWQKDFSATVLRWPQPREALKVHARARRRSGNIQGETVFCFTAKLVIGGGYPGAAEWVELASAPTQTRRCALELLLFKLEIQVD